MLCLSGGEAGSTCQEYSGHDRPTALRPDAARAACAAGGGVVSEALPFEQLPAESARAYAAFIAYRDMGPQRSVRDVAQKLDKSVTVIGRWSTQHNWVERARSYDAAMDARARQATEQEVIERRRCMLDKHAKQADELGQAAQMILDEFKDRVGVRGGMKSIDGRTLVKLVLGLPKMAETAQKLERLAQGEATERHDHRITRERAEQMTDDELDALLKDAGVL
jgi:hypothetical protein